MDFSNPRKNIAQFGLGEGKVVADFGAGSGHYAFTAAQAVGSTGHVYAIDVQQDLVVRVKKAAEEEGLGNIDVFWGDIETSHGTKLGDTSVDTVILANILFQVEDMEGLFSEVDRVLKTKGRVLIVDWDGSYGDMGPTEDHVVSAKDARSLFERHGYVFESSIEAGAHHYGFSMSKV